MCRYFDIFVPTTKRRTYIATRGTESRLKVSLTRSRDVLAFLCGTAQSSAHVLPGHSQLAAGLDTDSVPNCQEVKWRIWNTYTRRLTRKFADQVFPSD